MGMVAIFPALVVLVNGGIAMAAANCPEVGIGMGVPRPPIRLVGDPELLATIDAYRRGELPLVVPITLLRHCIRRHPDTYMERQHYLHPHPDVLSLRNAI